MDDPDVRVAFDADADVRPARAAGPCDCRQQPPQGIRASFAFDSRAVTGVVGRPRRPYAGIRAIAAFMSGAA
jgi:hypothetical protein